MASGGKDNRVKYKEDDEFSKHGLKDMRENKIFTDVVLVCDGGEIHAHRVILSLQSPYFRNMFLNDFKESATNEVDFSYVKKDVMLLIIDFIYLHEVAFNSDENVDNLIEIYQVCHLFEMAGLSRCCWKLILKNTNADSWLKIWELVLLHGNDGDVCKVLDYILENLSEIVENNFFALTYPQINILLEKINQNEIPMEEDFLEAIIQWSRKTNQPKDHLKAIFLTLNFDLISREFMNELWEKEKDLFEDTFFDEFFKLHFIPKLNPNSEFNSRFPLKIFFFRRYVQENLDPEVRIKSRIEIFDCEKNSFCKVIDDLPFSVGDDNFTPVQYGSDIYIINGVPQGEPLLSQSKWFLLYDWKTNQIVRKPSLLEPVAKPVTCINKNNIYLIDTFKKMYTGVHYFSVDEQKWFVNKHKDLKVIECVCVKDVVYLICSRSTNYHEHRYRLMTVDKLECNFHSNIPMGEPREIRKGSVTCYKDKMFVALSNYEWYIFDPDTQLWYVKKMSNPSFCLSGRCQCFANKFLMLFKNYGDRALYRFHANKSEIKKILTLSGLSEEDRHYVTLYRCTVERFLIYQ